MGIAADLALTSAVDRSDNFNVFARHIDPAWIEEALQATDAATLRRRRLPADRVVWLVIGMALMRDRPIVDIVRNLELALPGKTGLSVAASAVPQARSRVGSEPLAWLFSRTAMEWAHRSADRHRWRGLALYALDGTTVRTPDSAENRGFFGGQGAGGERGTSGYPLVRLAALMAVRSHLIAAASFGPYADERIYAANLWADVPNNSLTIVDRLYLQADVLAPLRQGGSERHWLCRAKTNTRWREIKKLGRGDMLVEIDVCHESRTKKPQLPDTMMARAIVYRRKGLADQTLLTTLLDAEAYPAKEIVALYHERWEIELGYDEIKTEMLDRLETIRSKSPDAVAQELWGLLLAYNLVRLEMEAIASDVDLAPTRISFVAALRAIRAEWQWSAITAYPGAIPKRLDEMRETIRRFVLPDRRTGRTFPRAVKLKMSNYARKRPVLK